MVMFIFLFISVYLTREPNLAGHVGVPILLQEVFVLGLPVELQDFCKQYIFASQHS